MNWELLRAWGSVSEDFSGVDGGWYITIDPASPSTNVLTGLNVRDILELIDLLPPVRSGEGPQ
jgi:hypothetical protein